jgi:hypothetical protein
MGFSIFYRLFYGKETLPDGRGTALMFGMILVVLCWFGWSHHRAL